MKLTGYTRISVGVLIFVNYMAIRFRDGYEWPQYHFEWINVVGFFLIDVVYISYCFRQGILELKGQNSELPYPRILAILIEALNVIFVMYFLITIKNFQFLPAIDFIITVGMAFLLIQDLRIVLSKK